jgi:hypothetical protein
VKRALACVPILLIVFSADASLGQSSSAATTATVSIGGRVTAEDGGTALAGVRVDLTGGPEGRPESRVTTTSRDGRYVFAELPPGTYAIKTSRTGFVPVAYG